MENGKLINENNIDKIRKTFSKNQSEIIKIYKKKKKKKEYIIKENYYFQQLVKEEKLLPRKRIQGRLKNIKRKSH